MPGGQRRWSSRSNETVRMRAEPVVVRSCALRQAHCTTPSSGHNSTSPGHMTRWAFQGHEIGLPATRASRVTDDQARDTTHRMQELGIPAGPYGGAALAGIQEALGEANRRAALAVTADGVLVLIST